MGVLTDTGCEVGAARRTLFAHSRYENPRQRAAINDFISELALRAAEVGLEVATDLEEAVRFLAWDSIINEKETLNLDPQQVKHAETQLKSADGTVTARLPETYQWLLVPEQKTPQDAVKWEAYRRTGQDPLAVRASERTRNEELLVPAIAGTRLRMELDKIPLWRGDHILIKSSRTTSGATSICPARATAVC